MDEGGLKRLCRSTWTRREPKRDSSYNNVVIEFKGPGLFKGSETSPKFIEATDGRLLKYIPAWLLSKGWMRRTTSVLPSTAIMWALPKSKTARSFTSH